MKKLNVAAFLIMASASLLGTAFGAGLPEPPVEFRLHRLGVNLGKLAAVEAGHSAEIGALVKRGKTFALKWERRKPDGAGVDRQTWEQVVALAVDSLKEKLPQGLRPEASRLLAVGKYCVTSSSEDFWVWIAEFQIDDETPVAGSGFRLTLFVPIALDGTVLLEVSDKAK